MKNRGDNTALALVVARAWQDPEFKKQLIENPHATLTKAGVRLRESVEYRVVENSAAVQYFVLPQPPRIDHSIESTVESILSSLNPLLTASVATSGLFPNMSTAISRRKPKSRNAPSSKKKGLNKKQGSTGPKKKGAVKKRTTTGKKKSAAKKQSTAAAAKSKTRGTKKSTKSATR